jgi:hypothetical protein
MRNTKRNRRERRKRMRITQEKWDDEDNRRKVVG